MAFGTKYRGEFTDDLALDWKIDFQVDPDPGAINTLQMSGDAMHITWYGDDDIMNQEIMGSKMDLNFESTADFLSDIFGIENLTCKVIVYQGSTVHWNGYVLSDGYSEPYDAPAFTVTIRATDGLGLLKDFNYDDLGYTARQTAAKMIFDILGKIKVTTFTEFINVYEESMTSTVDDSPLDQTTIDPYLFEGFNCYDALLSILKTFNSFIRQDKGVYEIIRVDELIDTTMYGRIFTSATAKSSTTKTPLHKISRTGDTSSFCDHRGGDLMILSPIKEVNLYQDYGDKDSWIRNYTFEGGKFSHDGTSYQVEEWTRQGMAAPGIIWIGWYVPTESDGVVITVWNNYPSYSKYIEQEFAHYAIVSDDTFTIQFNYRWLNFENVTRAGQTFYFSLENSAGTKYLVEDDEYWCSWQAGANKIAITEDVTGGFSSWKTWSRRIDGFEAIGPYKIKFYALDDAYNVFIAVGEVIFNQASDKTRVMSNFHEEMMNFMKRGGGGSTFNISFNNTYTPLVPPTEYSAIKKIVERKYSATNSINAPIFTDRYILGDITDANIENIIEQFSGALSTYTLTNQYRVDTITLTTGTAGGSADILCDGVTLACEYDTNLPTTAAKFVTDHAAAYFAGGVVVTSSGADIIFTSNVLGAEFTGSTTIMPDFPAVEGTVALTTSSHIHTTAATSDWNTRGGSESKELLSIVADNLAAQYARQKMFIDIPIRETGQTTFLSLNGNIQDSLNVNQLLTPVRTPAVWTLNNSTLVANWPYMRYTSTGVDPGMTTGTLSVTGSISRYINIRYKVISGSPGNTQIFYKTAGHNYSGSYYKQVTLTADGDWHVIILDMSSLTAGGTDWTDNIITEIRFDLAEATGSVIDLDWIGFPRKFAFSRALMLRIENGT
jgi:hypothetical protein